VVQEQARAYLQEATLKAVTAFAAARGLNAAISTLQNSSLTVGVGVSGNLALGQVLDPLNDLIERFSEVMLVSSVALGIQQLLLPLGLWLGLAVLVPVAMACFVAAVWLGPSRGARVAGAGWRILVAGLVVWLAVPVAAGTGSTVFEHFLTERYQQASADIEVARQRAHNLEERIPEGAPSREERWWQGWGLEQLDLRSRIQALTARAEAAVHSVIELTVIFLFQTLLLPLATLWGLMRVGRLVLRLPEPAA
jgi:hypothetical protein